MYVTEVYLKLRPPALILPLEDDDEYLHQFLSSLERNQGAKIVFFDVLGIRLINLLSMLLRNLKIPDNLKTLTYFIQSVTPYSVVELTEAASIVSSVAI